MTGRPPLAVTMGEPAGIGGEIVLKAWAGRRETGVPPFFVIDDPGRFADLASRLGLAVPVRAMAGPEAVAAAFAEGLPVLPQELAVPVFAGRPDPANGGAVIASIDRAVALVQAGRAAAVVTCPIQKSALYAAGFRHPGHTEYLAHLAETHLAGQAVEPVMMLVGGDLRVVPVTIHVGLRRAVETLTTAAIVRCGRVTAAALRRDFAIAAPRIAVAALNPHAGENGAMGREDIDIVAPAVAALQGEGIDAFGPLPPDTMFHAAARARYDAALCMYHDQALIPVKTLAFDSGVNVTLGLPFVRTSPDHGTALDIAGTGKEDATSLVCAMRMADSMAAMRRRAG